MGIVKQTVSERTLWRKYILIFVTVGSQQYPFDRLIKELDRLTKNGIISEEMFAQIGHSTYSPKYFNYENFMDKQQYQSNIDKCDILITHGGVGTIVSALKLEKKVIVMPRLQKYGEHIDDHQIQIAETLYNNGFIQIVNDLEDIEKSYTEIKNGKKFNKYHVQSQVLDIIENFIENI